MVVPRKAKGSILVVYLKLGAGGTLGISFGIHKGRFMVKPKVTQRTLEVGWNVTAFSKADIRSTERELSKIEVNPFERSIKPASAKGHSAKNLEIYRYFTCERTAIDPTLTRSLCFHLTQLKHLPVCKRNQLWIKKKVIRRKWVPRYTFIYMNSRRSFSLCQIYRWVYLNTRNLTGNKISIYDRKNILYIIHRSLRI